ncbi:MAG: hypothetical protein ACRYFU_24810 [Janthinobacterium lividum]
MALPAGARGAARQWFGMQEQERSSKSDLPTFVLLVHKELEALVNTAPAGTGALWIPEDYLQIRWWWLL